MSMGMTEPALQTLPLSMNDTPEVVAQEEQETAAPPAGPLGSKVNVDSAASDLVPAEAAVRLRGVPFAIYKRMLYVAMPVADDESAADELAILAGMPVSPVACTPEVFEEMIRLAYKATAEEMAGKLGTADGGNDDDLMANLEAFDVKDVHQLAEEPSVISLVNLIIVEAVRLRASDIHIEPFDKQVSIKYRVDGLLRPQNSPPRNLQAAITSRIKIMAGMDIAERYVPQDGHIGLRLEGRKVDIRVSTVPTIYGESVVMRLLDKQNIQLDLAALGMSSRDRESMDRLLALPHGMVLVTGPTGSGKTTTLYAALTKLYDPQLKMITIEDPVEYELHGVNQIPVNPDRGLMFATGLRAILRQDPDVVMVGEIRDGETAEIAVRAALTGHLIFSTLHTNDAASAVGRLLDMEIEPFLLASVLEGILAQRLGRRTCQMCKQLVPIAETLTHRLRDHERAMFPGLMNWQGAGCEKCDRSGFKGRIGYYELLLLNTEMRRRITEGHSSPPELLAAADSTHLTMRQDGLLKAANGFTSVAEVLQATQDVEE